MSRGLPERSHSRPAPPLRGAGSAQPIRGVRRDVIGEESLVDPLPIPPHKGGGESERPASCTISEAVLAAARLLRQAGIETPELDARLLLLAMRRA